MVKIHARPAVLCCTHLPLLFRPHLKSPPHFLLKSKSILILIRRYLRCFNQVEDADTSRRHKSQTQVADTSHLTSNKSKIVTSVLQDAESAVSGFTKRIMTR